MSREVLLASALTNQRLHVLVAVLVWKHQDRMVKVGYPSNDRDGVLKLYDQVIWADGEIKRLYSSCPLSPRESGDSGDGHGEGGLGLLLPGLALVLTAHKVSRPCHWMLTTSILTHSLLDSDSPSAFSTFWFPGSAVCLFSGTHIYSLGHQENNNTQG